MRRNSGFVEYDEFNERLYELNECLEMTLSLLSFFNVNTEVSISCFC